MNSNTICSLVNSFNSVDYVSLIEKLPNEIVGKILERLPFVTGSKGILNQADIPVTMRYMHHFACTSSEMYKCIHDPYITKLLASY